MTGPSTAPQVGPLTRLNGLWDELWEATRNTHGRRVWTIRADIEAAVRGEGAQAALRGLLGDAIEWLAKRNRKGHGFSDDDVSAIFDILIDDRLSGRKPLIDAALTAEGAALHSLIEGD